MSGSFTWDAIVHIGSIKAYEKALVLTVYHTLDSQPASRAAQPGATGMEHHRLL